MAQSVGITLYLLIGLVDFFLIKQYIKLSGKIEKSDLIFYTILMLIPVLNTALLVALVIINKIEKSEKKEKKVKYKPSFLKHLYGLKQEKEGENTYFTIKNKAE